MAKVEKDNMTILNELKSFKQDLMKEIKGMLSEVAPIQKSLPTPLLKIPPALS